MCHNCVFEQLNNEHLSQSVAYILPGDFCTCGINLRSEIKVLLFILPGDFFTRDISFMFRHKGPVIYTT